jgi:hypothetical protein
VSLDRAREEDPGEGAATTEDDDAELRCAACGHPVTRSAERIAVNGEHRHVCVNPHGIAYDIGCFRSAPGVRAEGSPTTGFTWFEGWAWQVGWCRSCGAHLGWWFSRGSERFAGLVVRRLREG